MRRRYCISRCTISRRGPTTKTCRYKCVVEGSRSTAFVSASLRSRSFSCRRERPCHHRVRHPTRMWSKKRPRARRCTLWFASPSKRASSASGSCLWTEYNTSRCRLSIAVKRRTASANAERGRPLYPTYCPLKCRCPSRSRQPESIGGRCAKGHFTNVRPSGYVVAPRRAHDGAQENLGPSRALQR